MPSVSGKSWRSVFRSRSQQDGESSSSFSPSQPIDSDAVSITSTRPPSYRSEATVTLPGYCADEDEDANSPPATPRVRPARPDPSFSVQTNQISENRRFALFFRPPKRPLSLSTLPAPIREEILSYLPINSRLCLKYTCSTLFRSFTPIISSTSLLGDAEFEASPFKTRHERGLLLAHLETCNLLPHPSSSPPANSKPPKTSEKHPEKPTTTPLLTCHACGLLHPATAFTPLERANSPFHRTCTGSTRLIALCNHSFLTWPSYTTEVTDDLHHIPAIHELRLLSHARGGRYKVTAAMSEREVVRRHYRGECLAWEGEAVDRDMPRGSMRFQIHRPHSGAVYWYACWSMDVALVWDQKRGGVCVGGGPRGGVGDVVVRPEKWASGEQAGAVVKALADRLDSFEMYMCPHLKTFRAPALYSPLYSMLGSSFEAGPGIAGSCAVCNADVRLYVYQGTGQFWVAVARPVGTGRSAMEKEWLAATHEPGEILV